MNHRNMKIGDMYLVCRDNVIWRVEYKGTLDKEGQVLYSNHRRYMAKDKAVKLDRAHKRLLESA